VVTENLRPRLQVHNVGFIGRVGAVTYRFEWSDRGDFPSDRRTSFKDNVPQGSDRDTAHEIGENLAPNTLHYWRARATRTQVVDKTEVTTTSEYSPVRSFTTPNVAGIRTSKISVVAPVPGSRVASSSAVTIAPHRDAPIAAAPSNLVATASASGVVLTWSEPSGATPVRYAISGGTAPHTSTLPVIVTADASNRYTIPALPPGSYSFSVVAILADGLSPPSAEATVVAGGSQSASGPPSGALAVIDRGYITATWTPSRSDGALYEVGIGSGPGQADVAVLTTATPSVTYRANAVTHYLRIRAVEGAMMSAPSNEVAVSVAPSICAARPMSPILLPVSSRNGETTISWLPAGGELADYYRVDGTASNGPISNRSRGSGTSLTATLEPGVYTIRVSAINTCGASQPSNSVTFTQPGRERTRP
jgi:hypothetical protein